jgi:hypothetical protein
MVKSYDKKDLMKKDWKQSMVYLLLRKKARKIIYWTHWFNIIG